MYPTVSVVRCVAVGLSHLPNRSNEALSAANRARKEAEEKAPTTMPIPNAAKVPASASALPLSTSYVQRKSLLFEMLKELTATDDVGDPHALSGSPGAVDKITSPAKALAPYTVFGMGGGGKTVLVSAVVRELSVRENFRGGIFLMSVGRGAKNRLLPLLQGLAREMGAAPAHAPHGNPGDLDSLEHVMQHLTTVASTGTSPRLVVLDDVWEREVVEALLPLGLKLVVTTRDRSVVGVPGGCLEVGDMTEEEALELLMLASGAVQPLPKQEALRVRLGLYGLLFSQRLLGIMA